MDDIDRWVAEAAKGSQEAFTHIVRLHQRRVRAYLRRIGMRVAVLGDVC